MKLGNIENSFNLIFLCVIKVLGGPVASSDPPAAATEIDEDELKRRTEFLRAQRDKVAQLIVKTIFFLLILLINC